MNAKVTFAEALTGALNAGSMILNDYVLSVVPAENGSKLVARRGSEVQELIVKNGEPGPDGVGIESIFQTVIGMGSGAKNEWLITLTDGRTETITIYNGESGKPASIIPAGETEDEILLQVTNAGQAPYMLAIPKGKNGFSPTIEVVEAYDTISLIITDVNGTQTVTIPLIPPSIDVPDNESPGGGTATTTITINGEGPDENGNFVVNTVSDVEIAQLSAALT